jgi:hypothetical protein
LVLAVSDWLNRRGLKQNDKKAVARAVAEIGTAEPFKTHKKSLRRRFYEAVKAEPPQPDPRDLYASRLREFGCPPEASYALADRLIAICTVKHPQLGLDY